VLYSQDWDGNSPNWCTPGGTNDTSWTYWRNRVIPYAPSTNVFQCPVYAKVPGTGAGSTPGSGYTVPGFGMSWCNYGVNACLSEYPASCGQSMVQPLARWHNQSETIALSENCDGDWVCEEREAACNVATIITNSPYYNKPLPFSVAGLAPPGWCGLSTLQWGCEGRWYPIHDGRASVCFLDGHVRLMKAEEVFATVNGTPFYWWVAK